MDDPIGYAIVAIVIVGSIYGLVKQIQLTLSIKSDSKSDKRKRLLYSNYLTSVSLMGLIISYILNVLVGLEVIQSYFITSNSTGVGCIFFLAILLISRFIITPRYK